ncbi:MAG: mandelate racemase/muconate lactonizing enzyme family protein [Dehalococcoidia bacterium]
MKIVSHEIVWVDVPLPRPFVSGSGFRASEVRHVVLKLRTDDGIEGLGWAYAHSHTMLPALGSAIDDVATMIQGMDPFMRNEIQNRINRATQWTGGGLNEWVSAVINFALYDIAGKALGQPVYKILGGLHTESVPTYASHKLWRDWSLDDLATGAAEIKADGFKMLKFRVGANDAALDERERAKVVREAVGPDYPIAVDINQGWDVARTMEVVPYLEEFRVHWLEDPIHRHDFVGYRHLVDALNIAITHGENLWDWRLFLDVVKQGAVDIAMIDAHHVGGIDGFIKAAAVCDAAYRPVVTHLSPEIAVHLGASVSNCTLVEYMHWSFGLFEDTSQINAEGRMIVPQKPGFGVTLNEELLKRGIKD